MFCTPTLDIIRPASNKVGYETDPKPMDPNPFASYKFHPIDPSFFGTWKIYPTTLRCPNSKEATAHSQPAEINKNLQAKVDFKKKTWELFQTTQWTTFSNASMKAADGTGPMTSLEGIHDAVHLCTGGTQTTNHGHMCSLCGRI
jgi:hypothetical protein